MCLRTWNALLKENKFWQKMKIAALDEARHPDFTYQVRQRPCQLR